jgi:hypothetical protein
MRFDFVYIVCRLFERAYIVCFDQDQNILNVQASQALLSFASMFSYPSHGFRRATKKKTERERDHRITLKDEKFLTRLLYKYGAK